MEHSCLGVVDPNHGVNVRHAAFSPFSNSYDGAGRSTLIHLNVGAEPGAPYVMDLGPATEDAVSMATDDPYAVLGVTRDATEKDIRAAYRRLAKQLHPDLHPGDKKAEERFKRVSAAHDLLSDAEKRRRFDAGEIDASGQEQAPRGYYRTYAASPEGGKYASERGFDDFADLGDVFADLFARGRRSARADVPIAGQDVSYTLSVPFLDAAVGTTRRVTMPDGRTLDVAIPEGVANRQTLRLRGQGMPGRNGGTSGDAYIEIHIEPHAFFRRKDNDVHVDVPVGLGEAVLGAKIEVPTVKGPVQLTVPKGSNTGTVLRLKARGILDPKSGQRGDQYVKLVVTLPEAADPRLEAFVREWAADRPYDPRARVGMKGRAG
jgi:DnaJ-class molecular chaperone